MDEAERAALAAAEAERIAALPTRYIYKLEDFLYDMTQEMYWDRQNMMVYGAEAIDAAVPLAAWEINLQTDRRIRPSESIRRIERDQIVETSTWWPGQPQIIADATMTENGLITRTGARILNTYREPAPIDGGVAKKAKPWLTHLETLYPTEYEDMLCVWAHMIQNPGEKCNTCVVLVGDQGIGKDLALQPVRNAVGQWNAREIAPETLFEGFNPYVESLMLVVNEARPSADHVSSQMYAKLKSLIAAPPDWIAVNRKYSHLCFIRNLCRVHITTNEMSALYIPNNDRRMFIANSQQPKGWANPDYFSKLVKWYEGGGFAHVMAYLRSYDLSKFNPKAQPRQTAAWHAIVGSWQRGEDDLLMKILNEMEWPDVVFGKQMMLTKIGQGMDTADELLKLLKSNRNFLHQMSEHGYNMVSPEDGRKEWQYRESGKVFRSRLAFVKRDLRIQGPAATSLVDKIGREIVEAMNATSKPSERSAA